jgi:hypothetical protein
MSQSIPANGGPPQVSAGMPQLWKERAKIMLLKDIQQGGVCAEIVSQK